MEGDVAAYVRHPPPPLAPSRVFLMGKPDAMVKSVSMGGVVSLASPLCPNKGFFHPFLFDACVPWRHYGLLPVLFSTLYLKSWPMKTGGKRGRLFVFSSAMEGILF